MLTDGTNLLGFEMKRKGYYRPEPLGGGHIAVTDAAGRLVRLSLSDGTGKLIWDRLPARGRFGWAIRGDTLVYTRAGGNEQVPQIVRRDLASGESRVLFSGDMPLADITISIGRVTGALLFTRHQAPSDDLVLYEEVPGLDAAASK